MRQLDMGDLKVPALTADNREILAPVELKRLAGAESQRNKSPASSRLLLALPISPPFPREGRNPAVGAGETELTCP